MLDVRRLLLVFAAAAPTALLAACGGEAGTGSDRATVVVTTSVLGDVVDEVAGDQVEVVTIMPPGADPHGFQPSARHADQMRRADALVANGAGFEEALLDVVGSARDDGVPTHAATGDLHAGDHPHFFTDPVRMAQAVDGIAAFLGAAVDGIDRAALERSAAAYRDRLLALDQEVEGLLAGIPARDRLLVTTHEVLGSFADRYGFEVVGTVIPGGSSADAASAGALAELADLVRTRDVPAIFVDTSSGDDLPRAVADEVGDIAIVELHTESLGEHGTAASTYIGMVRTNAERIAAALTR